MTMTLTNETWFASIENGVPEPEAQDIRRDVFLKQRKKIRDSPGTWQQLYVFPTRSVAVEFVRQVNRGVHPIFKVTAAGTYEAEHLFNLVYLIYRKELP